MRYTQKALFSLLIIGQSAWICGMQNTLSSSLTLEEDQYWEKRLEAVELDAYYGVFIPLTNKLKNLEASIPSLNNANVNNQKKEYILNQLLVTLKYVSRKLYERDMVRLDSGGLLQFKVPLINLTVAALTSLHPRKEIKKQKIIKQIEHKLRNIALIRSYSVSIEDALIDEWGELVTDYIEHMLTVKNGTATAVNLLRINFLKIKNPLLKKRADELIKKVAFLSALTQEIAQIEHQEQLERDQLEKDQEVREQLVEIDALLNPDNEMNVDDRNADIVKVLVDIASHKEAPLLEGVLNNISRSSILNSQIIIQSVVEGSQPNEGEWLQPIIEQHLSHNKAKSPRLHGLQTSTKSVFFSLSALCSSSPYLASLGIVAVCAAIMYSLDKWLDEDDEEDDCEDSVSTFDPSKHPVLSVHSLKINPPAAHGRQLINNKGEISQ